ncbi:hypothetical protein MKW94_012565 [Papaver nudicaule]|uniref:Desiccation-related protein PCC13-62 n=1 Tax=Papaver nudicaule TaxID=74823 RepID=A0AA41VD41_PAPNU|nr:hypothetical protein [Papaver nudicaule]
MNNTSLFIMIFIINTILILLSSSSSHYATATSCSHSGTSRLLPSTSNNRYKTTTSVHSVSESEDVPKNDIDLLEFPLNLEYLEAEFFLWGALGYGLDKIAPQLALGGQPPKGVKKAKLGPFTRDIITQFAFQEVGHLRAIKEVVGGGFPRPLLDLSAKSFAKVMDSAFGFALVPPFDPYSNELNYLLATYLVPYVGLTGYVGSSHLFKGDRSKKLAAGLLAVESAQDAVVRAYLYERAMQKVSPYGITVAEFTAKISMLRDKLGGDGLMDEGIVVPPSMGAEGKISGNVIAGNDYSVAYRRTPKEILRIVYGGNGNEHVPGGFFPNGANGTIATSYL